MGIKFFLVLTEFKQLRKQKRSLCFAIIYSNNADNFASANFDH